MKKIMPIPIIISILVTLFIIPMSYAIYRSYSTGGVTSAAASWNVSLNQNNVNNNLTIIPGENGTTASYTINITSNSEVDVIYSIVIENLPSGVSISLDDGSFVAANNNNNNNKVVFTDVGTILYSDANKNKSHVITIKANSNTQYVNNQEIDVNVIARQAL